MVNFRNKPDTLITIQEFEKLFNSIGLKWYGWSQLSTKDRDFFEDKMNISFEPTKEGMVKLYDLNFNYED
jgi:hypothetical protein